MCSQGSCTHNKRLGVFLEGETISVLTLDRVLSSGSVGCTDTPGILPPLRTARMSEEGDRTFGGTAERQSLEILLVVDSALTRCFAAASLYADQGDFWITNLQPYGDFRSIRTNPAV